MPKGALPTTRYYAPASHVSAQATRAGTRYVSLKVRHRGKGKQCSGLVHSRTRNGCLLGVGVQSLHTVHRYVNHTANRQGIPALENEKDLQGRIETYFL